MTTATINMFDFVPGKSEAISKVCQATKWNQNLVFTYDKFFKEVRNIRNSVLYCSDISQIKGELTTDSSYMFDTQHFIDSLHLSSITLLPENIVEGNIPLTGLVHPEQWRETFNKWLEEHKRETAGPTIVVLGRSYLTYPIYSDGESFALRFGNILKIRSYVRRLATSALRKMAEIYHLKLDFSKPILPHAFFGVHLRTEKDAVIAWSTVWKYRRYEPQSRHYLSQAPRSTTSIIYVASADPGEVDKFSRDAKEINMTVTTKLALLQGQEKEDNFSQNIALRRRVHAKKKEKIKTTVLLKDKFSYIYGIKRPEYKACLWL
ncbi:hypothetical protein F5884DRAFT_825430 [Xylogone sp. PMI_703]|nr:hypothetical protein F5884DRAFT_825430 [Xylogone sp. PMI_703]